MIVIGQQSMAGPPSADTWPTWLAVALVALALAALLPVWVRLGIVLHHRFHHDQGWRDAVQNRFRHQSAMAWLFAWCKLRMDPMFHELLPATSPPLRQEASHGQAARRAPAPHEAADPLRLPPDARRLLDIGSGYGIVSAALLTWLPQATILAVDPSAARVRSAAGVIGDRGQAHVSAAPDFLPADHAHERFDAVFLIDVIHFLDDAQLGLTLARVAQALTATGQLYLRAIIPPLPPARGSLLWHYENRRRRWLGIPTHHRDASALQAHLARAGLTLRHTGPSGGNAELHWFIATPARG